ncbi:MAG: transposase [Clostridiales bacterium]|nr:transposase [Clostridiales bacterium]
MKPYGEIVASPYVVEYTEKELKSLTKMIFELEEEVKVVMEATGAYRLPLLGFLLEREIVRIIDPMRSSGISNVFRSLTINFTIIFISNSSAI